MLIPFTDITIDGDVNLEKIVIALVIVVLVLAAVWLIQHIST